MKKEKSFGERQSSVTSPGKIWSLILSAILWEDIPGKKKSFTFEISEFFIVCSIFAGDVTLEETPGAATNSTVRRKTQILLINRERAI